VGPCPTTPVALGAAWWDPVPPYNLQNFAKHGVASETAAEAFFDPFLCLTDAGTHAEDRLAFLGMTETSRLLFVVFTERQGERYRVISARPATRSERREYEGY